MPTLADIYSAINTFKRKSSDFVQNPGTSLEQILFAANENAREFNKKHALATDYTIAQARGQQPTPEQTQAEMGLRNTLSEAYTPGMIVYHGSPYKFTKFDANKIGSGEGNQVYGHGLYFAEAPAVAEGYKQTLKSKQFSKIVQKGRNDYDVVTPDGQVLAKSVYLGQANKAKNAFDTNVGSLYKVDLPDEKIAAMLDWDKPVPESMREVLSKSMTEKFGSGATGTSGEKLYKEIQKNYEWAGSKNPALDASNFLKEHGIPGVKYLDAGSRNKGGTSNFVVFDPSYLSILERNQQTLK
jgi:hypothetical protein